jgi:cytochrome c biogenesis factor
VGIAVMIFGIVVAGTMGKTARVSLHEGESVEALGFTLTYEGMESDERGRRRLRVHVEREDWVFEARPILMESPQTGSTIRTPAISGAHDLYISPLEATVGSRQAEGVTWLDKGQEVFVDEVGYTFAGFRMESHEDLTVFADLDVRHDGTTHRASPAILSGPDGRSSVDAEVSKLGTISLAQIDADNQRVAVALPGGVQKPGHVSLELSTKPLIHLVWIGALVALLGTAIAGMRRATETVPMPAPAAQVVQARRPLRRRRTG